MWAEQRQRSEALRTINRDCECHPWKYLKFCFLRICILGDCEMLFLVVVKIFNIVNDVQLRMTCIIWRTRIFFLKMLIKFQQYLGTGRGHGPSGPVMNMPMIS